MKYNDLTLNDFLDFFPKNCNFQKKFFFVNSWQPWFWIGLILQLNHQVSLYSINFMKFHVIGFWDITDTDRHIFGLLLKSTYVSTIFATFRRKVMDPNGSTSQTKIRNVCLSLTSKFCLLSSVVYSLHQLM